MHEHLERRLRRKIELKDKKIAGLKRKIAQLESVLSLRVLSVDRMSIDIERAVEHALCNVRMIPVHGLMKTAKIIEVRSVEEEQ